MCARTDRETVGQHPVKEEVQRVVVVVVVVVVVAAAAAVVVVGRDLCGVVGRESVVELRGRRRKRRRRYKEEGGRRRKDEVKMRMWDVMRGGRHVTSHGLR